MIIFKCTKMTHTLDGKIWFILFPSFRSLGRRKTIRLRLFLFITVVANKILFLSVLFNRIYKSAKVDTSILILIDSSLLISSLTRTNDFYF